MPLIKELKSSNRPFKSMIEYFLEGAKENDLQAFYNTGLAETEEQLTRVFIEDSKFKDSRSKSFKHCIISFSPEDEKSITDHPELLLDILDRYVHLRGYDMGVCYFVLHRPKSGAIHWHGMVSTHRFESSKSMRSDLKDYVKQNKELEYYQQEKWGHVLKKSIAYIDKEKPQDKKLKRTQRDDYREFVIEYYNKIADESTNLSDFYNRIEKANPDFSLYKTSRDKINGCTYKSYKWRFSTHLDKEKYLLLQDLEQLKNLREGQRKGREMTR